MCVPASSTLTGALAQCWGAVAVQGGISLLWRNGDSKKKKTH